MPVRPRPLPAMDCRVATLLAMTGNIRACPPTLAVMPADAGIHVFPEGASKEDVDPGSPLRCGRDDMKGAAGMTP